MGLCELWAVRNVRERKKGRMTEAADNEKCGRVARGLCFGCQQEVEPCC